MKRPRSNEFSAGKRQDAANYALTAPVALWARVKAAAAREGTSIRTLILRLLTWYVDHEGTGPDTTAKRPTKRRRNGN